MHAMADITETDSELAARAHAGSLDCFEELVRRYQVPLLRFLQRRSPNPRDAEDVIQDAFLRAYQSIGSFRQDQPFKPWLFTIAYRLAIDTARRRRPLGPSFDELTRDSDQTPLDHATRNDSKDHLWQTVRRVLKDEPFTAVWLHYGESMPTADIAKVIGRSQDWVKTTLLRARGKIREALEQNEGASHE
jgi:RNA polymerase sigma-70 factor (ECF subfamily)